MSERSQVEADLGFVRGVLERSEHIGSPAEIYFLWAAIVLVGFPLADIAPAHTGTYWVVAGPGGWILSAILGRRFARRIGQVSTEVGARYALHWGGLLGAIALVVLMQAGGAVSPDVTGQIILLVVALTYFLAGVHLDRPMLWLSLLMVAGFAALLVVEGPVWTVTGILLALGLAATPLLQGRRRADTGS